MPGQADGAVMEGDVMEVDFVKVERLPLFRPGVGEFPGAQEEVVGSDGDVLDGLHPNLNGIC